MKTIKILFVIALVIFSGFAWDSQTDENLLPKRAAIPIPMNGSMCIVTANQNMPVEGTPVIGAGGVVLVPQLFLVSTASLDGHGTHLGNYIVEQSTMTGISAHLDFGALSQGKIVLIADYYGTITAANGDHLDFESSIVIDATDQSQGGLITGTYSFSGGSGRFQNAGGNGVLNGRIPCWDIEGTLEFSR
jgi:hypothetical protein